MATLDLTPSAGDQDWTWVEDLSEWRPTDPSLIWGQSWDADSETAHSGIRVTGGPPQGSTINEAHVTFTNKTDAEWDDNEIGTVLTKIFGMDDDDFAIPTSYATADADHALHTTAAVDWDVTNATSGTLVTPDIAAIIQEIVDRAGYSGTLALHFDDDGTAPTGDQRVHIVHSFEGTTDWVLHIDYTEEGGGGEDTVIAADPYLMDDGSIDLPYQRKALPVLALVTGGGLTLAGNAAFLPGLSWPQGQINLTLLGNAAFLPGLSWPTGRLNLTLSGNAAFQPALSWPTGVLTPSNTLAGNAAFLPGLSWPTGTVQADQILTGDVTFLPGLSWPTGALSFPAQTLSGNASFLPGLSWPTGVLTPSNTLTGNASFLPGLSWPLGTVLSTQTLSGILFQSGLSWPLGLLAQAQTLLGASWSPLLSWPTGSLSFSLGGEFVGNSPPSLSDDGSSPSGVSTSGSGLGLENSGRTSGRSNTGKSPSGL